MTPGMWGGLVLHQHGTSRPPVPPSSSPPVTAALTGTMTADLYESEIVAGGQTLLITLTNDTWVASGTAFNAQRQNILNGISSAQSEATGWNALQSGLAVTDVVRTSATVVTITLDALATYAITAAETLTVVVPGTAVNATHAITADTTLTIIVGAPASSGTLVDDGFYIYTHEAVDANTLLAEDWSDTARGWTTMHCDDANGSGGLAQSGVHGWCMTIYAPDYPWVPTNAVDVVGGVQMGSTGTLIQNSGGGGGGIMGDHNLKSREEEIWFRYYIKPNSGYTFGAEKKVTFNDGNAGDGGIKWGNFSWNCAGGPDPTGTLTMGFTAPEDVCSHMTPNYALSPGHWYFIELHMKLNTLVGTANGEFHCWADDCGTGNFPVNPGGSPTLRLARTNVNYNRLSSSEKISVVWLEAWSNPSSLGVLDYMWLKVAKAGPVGFSALAV
jgi:hypothetical protein